jgi:steroid 5-alpha reductase family enzyme
VSGDIWTLLGMNLAILLVVMSLLALPSLRTRDPSYVDAFWGVGFVLVAVTTLLQTDGDPTRVALLIGLTALWGTRLGGYLFWRWRRNGPDPRYQRMLAGHTNHRLFLWKNVFLLQAVLLLVMSLPVQLGQVYDGEMTPGNWVGAIIALLGILFESTADLQLARFKRSAENAGQVMDRGLWRHSRHPNYFGEAVTWWGLGILAVSNGPTMAALLGPLVLTFFLLRVSGVTMLERSLTRTKPQYADYIRSTSAFLPMKKKDA